MMVWIKNEFGWWVMSETRLGRDLSLRYGLAPLATSYSLCSDSGNLTFADAWCGIRM